MTTKSAKTETPNVPKKELSLLVDTINKSSNMRQAIKQALINLACVMLGLKEEELAGVRKACQLVEAIRDGDA